MQSKATTVEAYLKELPPDRRSIVEAVRKVILQNVGPEIEEGMQYGMIGFYIPHRVYPAGYHCDPKQPLSFIALASQKNHLSLYMMTIYGAPDQENWFRTAWSRTGKKLDMGKCCIRFKSLDGIALDVVAEAIRRIPVPTYIDFYERSIGLTPGSTTATENRKQPSAKPAAKPAAKKTAEMKTAEKKPAASGAALRKSVPSDQAATPAARKTLARKSPAAQPATQAKKAVGPKSRTATPVKAKAPKSARPKSARPKAARKKLPQASHKR